MQLNPFYKVMFIIKEGKTDGKARKVAEQKGFPK
jgi:hypothetical protein